MKVYDKVERNKVLLDGGGDYGDPKIVNEEIEENEDSEHNRSNQNWWQWL